MNETFARHVIEATPLVDGFCRPLLEREQQEEQQQSGPLSLLFPGTGSTLARSRAVRQLAKLLGCPSTPADVDAALTKRREDSKTYGSWTKRCLNGIQTLVQSPLAGSRDAASADTARPSPNKRVAQVEQLLESFFEDSDGQPTDAPWDDFKWVIDRAIEDVVELADVCGLDSISCLHGGPPADAEAIIIAAQEAYGQLMALERERDPSQPAPAFRLQHPNINRYVLHRLATHIRDSTSLETRKPIRLHAGHGHTDGHALSSHASSSPADLQNFVASYPSVPFVLMGAGYPKVREAAYLASANPNVYVDLALVLPLLDRQGQEQVLREALEVCPWTKILAGSGGRRLPESYYLGQLQLREALSTVLCGLARSGDLSWDEVADAARSILYVNASKLYHLDLPDLSVPNGDSSSATRGTTVLAPHPTPAEEQLRILQNEMIGRRSHGAPAEFVAIGYIDYVGLHRQKSVHVSHLWPSLQSGSPLSTGVAGAIFGMLPSDHSVPGLPPTGEYRLHPDYSWIKRTIDGDITMHGDFRNQDDSHVDMCPRMVVRKVLDMAKKHGLEFRVGFEIELVIMQCDDRGNGYQALDHSGGHAWSSVRATRYPTVMPLLRKAVAHLADNGIVVEQLHAESAPGQFELVLAHAPPLEAIDNLIFARQVLADAVAEKGYVMTLHPKPFPNLCGTAAHAHMSICSPGGNDPAVYEPFYAGILNRLPSITAFTLPSPASWSRAVDGAWAGGTHVSWGTQNRETPLRKLKNSHWEIKCIDGVANPFFVMASLVAAGTLGFINKEPMHYKNMCVDPSTLSSEERAKYGVTQKLPGSTPAAVKALSDQKDLCAALGEAFVDRFIVTKLYETEEWEKMSETDQRKWVLDRF
jgi:glutamine synthetase